MPRPKASQVKVYLLKSSVYTGAMYVCVQAVHCVISPSPVPLLY